MPWMQFLPGGEEVIQVYAEKPEFHPDVPLVETSDPNVAPGWTYVDGVASPPVEVAATQDELLRHAAIVRYRVETTGALVGGRRIASDRDSRGLIDRLVSWLLRNEGVASVAFKTLDGWDAIPRAEMIAIPDALEQRAQDCFAAERAVAAAIAAGTITTFAAVEAASWPA